MNIDYRLTLKAKQLLIAFIEKLQITESLCFLTESF
jgi:hypothetical protein